jgi:hypothetical protein
VITGQVQLHFEDNQINGGIPLSVYRNYYFKPVDYYEDYEKKIGNPIKLHLYSNKEIDLMKSKNKYHNIEYNIMKNTFGDKVANILEEKFDNYKSNIENRTFISQEIIDFVFNYIITS